MCKWFVIISFFLSLICTSKLSIAQDESLCGPVTYFVSALKDSLNTVLIINESPNFVTNGYDDFSRQLQNIVPRAVIKKAYKSRYSHVESEILKCLKNESFITFKRFDSIRSAIRGIRIDSLLEDSINNQINLIFKDFDGNKRDSLYKLLLNNDTVKGLENSKKHIEVHSLLISDPIIINKKFLFFQISIINSNPHFFTSNCVFKKEHNSWKLISKYDW